MPVDMNIPEFVTYQGAEYVRVTQGSEYVCIIPVLSMPGLHRVLNMSASFLSVCLIMPEITKYP